MTHHALGGDPGQDGAVSLFEVGETIELKQLIAFAADMEGDDWLTPVFDLTLTYRPEMIRLEDVHFISGQGGTSSFNFGWAAGTLNTVVKICGLPFERVTPQVWQRRLNLPQNHHIQGDRQRRAARLRDQKRIAIATFPELKEYQKSKYDPFAGVLIGYYAAVLLLDQLHGDKHYVVLQQDKLYVTSTMGVCKCPRAPVGNFDPFQGASAELNIVPPPQRFIRR